MCGKIPFRKTGAEGSVKGMAKATTTIKQMVSYRAKHAAWFAANQTLFNQVVAFYFEVIQAHEKILELKTKEALTALETLTHETRKNPNPMMPLSTIGEDIPALFRRAAIHAALGSAKSFSSHLKKWRKWREKATSKGKPFRERPPVPPRTWNKSAPFYVGQWKERTESSIVLKVWTGSCWSWVKVRLSGRDLPVGHDLGSPQLIRHGDRWWLHTPVEKTFAAPAKVEQQVIGTPQTRICAVDLNLGDHIAVCTVQTVEDTILATTFIGGGDEINGFRKRQLGRIARNRRKTGLIAEGEQDNAALWQKLRHRDDDEAHRVSARIVQFAVTHGASILAFEHLGTLRPEKGKYSRRGNAKRAFWMKGRIFKYAKYKAWTQRIITSRVNPRNTSRECARCHAPVVRYCAGQPEEGYTKGAPLVLCPNCQMRGHADRNASLVIGQRLIHHYQKPLQEKPQAPRPRVERVVKATGVSRSQDAKSRKKPSISRARHGERIESGTAQGGTLWMGECPPSIPTQLRLFTE
jgi:transposase